MNFVFISLLLAPVWVTSFKQGLTWQTFRLPVSGFRLGIIHFAEAHKTILFLLLVAVFSTFTGCRFESSEGETAEKPALPNIVLILADDLGYGDAGVYNPEAKVRTPNIDRLAREGMRFTDAHSPSSVCTPTRYGILTGRYAWRSGLKKGVLWGFGRTFMDTARTNLASLLKAEGYRTGVVGKWHLGLDWAVKEAYRDSIVPNANGIVFDTPAGWLDFSRPVAIGANDYGFDYSYILPASLDIPPYCYVENDTILGGLSGYTEGNDLDKGFAEAFWRPGPMTEGFSFEGVLPRFTQKAKNFIAESAKSDSPFFLYFPLNAPHTPWVATAQFDDSSEAGKYGDFVQQVDHEVGQIMQTLEEQGLADNTLVIFTSDNGPFWKPDYIEKYQHRAAGNLRGMKADAWEGGHRVPFIVKWPGQIEGNSQNDTPITQTCLLATLAEIREQELGPDAGEDSESILPLLLQKEEVEPERKPIIHHSSRGVFAIRSGPWKLIEGLGSGGFSEPVHREPEADGPEGQLYNLENDLREQHNLYLENPAIVNQLKVELRKIRNSALQQ